ncbi:hypothetical protein F4776DRAFT_18101 [Hypoxylon sp. NC0597]|nr:hypothetical protein F4776DRAFT_18101 [Hypoxylon sp. NC0597]
MPRGISAGAYSLITVTRIIIVGCAVVVGAGECVAGLSWRMYVLCLSYRRESMFRYTSNRSTNAAAYWRLCQALPRVQERGIVRIGRRAEFFFFFFEITLRGKPPSKNIPYSYIK